MEGLQFEFAKPMLPAPSLYTNYPYGGYPPFHNPNSPMNFRPAGMGPPNARMSRPGAGIPAGMGPQQNQPKSPGRGRGILGKGPGSIFMCIKLFVQSCTYLHFVLLYSLIVCSCTVIQFINLG